MTRRSVSTMRDVSFFLIFQIDLATRSPPSNLMVYVSYLSKTPHQLAFIQVDGWFALYEGALQQLASSMRNMPSLPFQLSFL